MNTPLQLSSCLLLALAAAAPAQRVGGGLDKTQSWYGVSSGDLFGISIAKLDDLDGDTIPDLAIGAPGVDGAGLIQNVGLVEIRSSLTGALITSFSGSGGVSFENFGLSVEGTGDLDGDGTGDYAIGVPGLGPGQVVVRSGATHAPILVVVGPAGAEDFGGEIVAIGDVDADGTPDLAVGAEDADTLGLSSNGAFYVVSGADGAILRTHHGSNNFAGLGDSLANVGDLDGDGVNDYAAGETGADPGGIANAGSAWVWSGATGAQIHRWDGTYSYQWYGWDVGSAGDADGDGVPDVAVGAPLEDPISLDEGVVRVYSGASGALIWDWHPQEEIEHAGMALDTIGDFDQDGLDDLLVGADGRAWGGRVYLLSGADASRLHIFESEGWSHDMGAEVEGMGDLDGDGELEAAISAISAWNGGPSPGGVYLYTFSPYLTASGSIVSAAAGGTITLELDFPSEGINGSFYHSYGLLASATGIGPTTLAGWKVPLTPDGLYAQTFAGNYPSQVRARAGSLSPDGDATVTITFAPGTAANLVGRTFFLSAIGFENPPWETIVHGASVVAPLTFVP